MSASASVEGEESLVVYVESNNGGITALAGRIKRTIGDRMEIDVHGRRGTEEWLVGIDDPHVIRVNEIVRLKRNDQLIARLQSSCSPALAEQTAYFVRHIAHSQLAAIARLSRL